MNSGFSGIQICPWHLPICFRDLLPPSALEEEPSRRSRGLVSQRSSGRSSRRLSENPHLKLSPYTFPEQMLQGPTDSCASIHPLQALSSLKASGVCSAIAVQGFMYVAPISVNGS